MKLTYDTKKSNVKITIEIEASPEELQEIRADLRNIVCDDVTNSFRTDELLNEIVDAIDDTD